MSLFTWRATLVTSFALFLFLISTIVVTLIFQHKIRNDEIISNRIDSLNLNDMSEVVMVSHWIWGSLIGVLLLFFVISSPSIAYYTQKRTDISLTGLNAK